MKHETKNVKKKRKIAQEFLSSTSMHGLKYVVEENRHYSERILWVIMFGIGVLFSAYMSWIVWKKFDASPMLLNIESTGHPLSKVDFPAVTICSNNKISKSKLNKVLQRPKYRDIDEKALISAIRTMAEIDYALNQTEEMPNLSNFGMDTEELINLTLQVSVSCSDFLMDCSWLIVSRPCTELLHSRPSDDGLCCTFNGLSPDWSLESTKNSDMKNPFKPKRVEAPGVRMGLTVALDYKVQDVMISAGKSDSFIALIHEAKDFPEVRQRGILVSPGTEVNVGVDPIWSYNTKSVNELPIRKRECIMDQENFLEFYVDYSPNSCYMECQTKLMIQNCSCHPYFYPADSRGKICSIEDYSCIIKIHEYYLNYRKELCSHCYPNCDDLWFNQELSYAQFPGAMFNQSRLSNQLKTKLSIKNYDEFFDYLGKNVALLNVYYRQPTGLIYSIDMRFGMEDFVSAIGGLLGLGFGFSFISAMEIFCLIGIRFICSDSNRSNRSNRLKRPTRTRKIARRHKNRLI